MKKPKHFPSVAELLRHKRLYELQARIQIERSLLASYRQELAEIRQLEPDILLARYGWDAVSDEPEELAS